MTTAGCVGGMKPIILPVDRFTEIISLTIVSDTCEINDLLDFLRLRIQVDWNTVDILWNSFLFIRLFHDFWDFEDLGQVDENLTTCLGEFFWNHYKGLTRCRRCRRSCHIVKGGID